jgi:tRNA threonylcarbamoyladenosine biosynthesis protein TsaB
VAYLYLDTSSNFHYGLLNEELQWVDFQEVETKRTSEIIHAHINDILNKHNLNVPKLKGVFVLSGPGSYTGMRVAEGVAQILELEGVKIYSFTTFRLSEEEKEKDFMWVYEAFKGEIFFRDPEGVEKLIKLEDLDKSELPPRLFSHGALSNLKQVLGCEVVDFSKLIQEKPEEVFSYVLKKEFRDKPFYFRPVEVEFSKSLK